MENQLQKDNLEAFYDKGGVLPGSIADAIITDKPLAPLESHFCADLADATGFTLTDVISCYKYVKSFDDTAKICELARLQNISLNDLVAEAKAGQATAPEAVEVQIKAHKSGVNLEFNGRYQYLSFSFSGAKQFAENLLGVIRAQKEQNKKGLYVPDKPQIIL